MKKILFFVFFVLVLFLISSHSKAFAVCVAGTGSTTASCGNQAGACQCNGSSCATQGYYCSAGNCVYGWAGGSSCAATSCSPYCPCPGSTIRCSSSCVSCYDVSSCTYGYTCAGCSPSCNPPPPPNCNTGAVYGSCSNSCGSGTTTSCTYTTYSGGGACTQVSCPNVACSNYSGCPTCNTNPSCGSCSVTCGGGTQTCTYTAYTGGGTCNQTSYEQSCNTQSCSFSVTGNVYVDANRSGTQDNGETGYTSGTNVGLDAGNTTTDGSGNYSFTGITSATHTVTVTLPNGYTASTTNPVIQAMSSAIVVNFGIIPPCSFPKSGNHTITASCTPSLTTVGVDAGSGTVNTASLTIQAGASLTIGNIANQTLVYGSITIQRGASIIINKGPGGATLKKGALWMLDTNQNGYPDTANAVPVYSATDLTASGYSRLNNMVNTWATAP